MNRFVKTGVLASSIVFSPVVLSAGGFIGVGALETSLSNSDGFDGSDTSYSVKGGYMFNDNIGAEFAYADVGDITDGRGSVDGDIISGAVIGAIPLNPISLYGKIGYAGYNLDGLGNAAVVNEEDGGIFGGVGVEWMIGSVGLYLEYLTFDTDVDVDSIGAGVKFHFPE